jgi:hypothetical protein
MESSPLWNNRGFVFMFVHRRLSFCPFLYFPRGNLICISRLDANHQTGDAVALIAGSGLSPRKNAYWARFSRYWAPGEKHAAKNMRRNACV